MLSYKLQLSSALLLLIVAKSFGASTFHDSFAAPQPEDEKAPPFRSLSDAELERFRPIIGDSPGQASANLFCVHTNSMINLI